MIYRNATIEDCKQLDKLLNKLIEDEKQYDNDNKEKIIIKDFYKNYIEKTNNKIYVCVDNDLIVGYIYIIKENDENAIIDALYVEQKYRNKGIATELINLAVIWFKDNNIKNIKINVLTHNLKAKKLYKKFNFQPYKETLKLKI